MRLSLTTKIVLLVSAAVLAALFVIGAGMREIFQEGQGSEWRRNMVSVVSLVSRQILADPRPQTIDALAAELGVGIRLTGPHGTYATEADIPTRVHTRRDRQFPRSRRFHGLTHNAIDMFWHESRVHIAYKHGPHQIIYRQQAATPIWAEVAALVAWTLAALLLLFALALFLVRRQLKPLTAIAGEMENFAVEGVAAAKGSRPAKDEIQQVADSYARMRARVENLLASKETLLRDVSHEVRSPLARMRLALEFIDDEETRTRLTNDIRILDELAGELLERAKLDAGSTPPQLEAVDLGALAAAELDQIDNRRGHVQLVKPAEPVRVLGNHRLLARCLGNIVDNSLKYSRLGDGSVKVEVYAERDGDRRWGVLRVSDEGAQMNQEEIDRLFEPFYRPEQSRARYMGGTGLGLAIVASIVQALGGELAADSPPSGGLRTTVKIPAADA